MSTPHRMGAALAAALTLAAAPAAEANGERPRHYTAWHRGPYVTGLLGGAFGGELDLDNTAEVDLEGGFLIGATLGYDDLFASPSGDFRLEVEGSVRSQDFDDAAGEVDLTALLLNFWYDFAVSRRWSPYAGAGLGVAFVDEVNDRRGFAWQFGGGLNFHPDRKVVLGLNYRYLLTGIEADGFGQRDLEYASHQLSASVGYKF